MSRRPQLLIWGERFPEGIPTNTLPFQFTAFDDFTLPRDALLNRVEWFGSYSAPAHEPIVESLIGFWSRFKQASRASCCDLTERRGQHLSNLLEVTTYSPRFVMERT